MKAQISATFQWMFVLIAGITFLIMFFSLARGCAQQGETQAEFMELDRFTRTLEAATWRPDSTVNLTVDSIDVTCPAGTLTFVTEEASLSVNRVPVFLPPQPQGNVQLWTRGSQLEGGIAPPIPLGNIMYGIDEYTYFILILDSSGAFPLTTLVGQHGNIKTIPVTEIEDPVAVADLVPGTARTIVIVSQNDEGYLTSIDTSRILRNVRGVALLPTGAVFYERRNDVMTEIGKLPAPSQELQAGAVIASDPFTYRCGRLQYGGRMEQITDLYERRARDLQEGMSEACSVTYTSVIGKLSELNAEEGENYLDKMAALDYQLVQLQESLLRQSCPVIA